MGSLGALLLVAALGATGPRPLSAQDAIVTAPPAEIEAVLLDGDFEVTARKSIRSGPRSTDLVIVNIGAQRQFPAKWARAPEGGEEWNNTPRYELAAYEVQKLFLDPADYVVPPTVCRCFTRSRYAELTGRTSGPDPTFGDTDCVLTVLQYWLRNVTSERVWDPERARRDTAYARHLANLDVLTYLIRHRDANTGNFLVSTLPQNPRVFAVDNGVSFEAQRSPRGYDWQWLRVDAVPHETVERLRALTPADLARRLGVLVQFEETDGAYEATRGYETRDGGETGGGPANLDPTRGVRVADGVIQLGLEQHEIDGLYQRLQKLLSRVDSGDLDVY